MKLIQELYRDCELVGNIDIRKLNRLRRVSARTPKRFAVYDKVNLYRLSRDLEMG